LPNKKPDTQYGAFCFFFKVVRSAELPAEGQNPDAYPTSRLWADEQLVPLSRFRPCSVSPEADALSTELQGLTLMLSLPILAQDYDHIRTVFFFEDYYHRTYIAGGWIAMIGKMTMKNACTRTYAMIQSKQLNISHIDRFRQFHNWPVIKNWWLTVSGINERKFVLNFPLAFTTSFFYFHMKGK